MLDLSQLVDTDLSSGPVVFNETNHYAGFGKAHNIAINEESGYAYIVGSDQCTGGLYMVNLEDPSVPQYAGCFGEDGYVHDAQCM